MQIIKPMSPPRATMPHRRMPSEVDCNKTVNWINSPGVWVWYLSIIVAGWLLTSALTNDPGLAWTYVHLVHGLTTYYLLHWTKGSPIQSDQGKWDRQVLRKGLTPQGSSLVCHQAFARPAGSVQSVLGIAARPCG